MPKQETRKKAADAPRQKPSALVDTRVIYCGDNLEQLKKLPDGCVDLVYIDPPFNSNRNYEVFWGETNGECDDCRKHSPAIKRIAVFIRPVKNIPIGQSIAECAVDRKANRQKQHDEPDA